MWYDGRSRDGKEVFAVKKRVLIALVALAAVLAAVFLALVLPGLNAGEETARESADIPPFAAGDLLACRDWIGKSADELALPDAVLGAQRLYSIVAVEGTLCGAPGYGTAYFSGTDETVVSAVYLHSRSLSYASCFEALRALYGEPFEQGEETYSGPVSGTALWSKFRIGECILELTGTTREDSVSLSLRPHDTY